MTKKSKKVLIIVLAFAFAISMVFTGCAARKPVAPNTGYNLGAPMTQSDNIARAAQTVPGVISARAVIMGTTAYVGINLDRNAKLGNTNTAGAPNTGTNAGTYGTPNVGGYGTTGATGTGTTGTGVGTTGVGTTGVNTGAGYGTTNQTYTGTGTVGTGTTGLNNRGAGTGVNTGTTGAGTTNNSGLIGIGNNRIGNTTDNISNIKRQVASAVRSADTTITTVYVSTDPSFMNRLQRISNDVKSGKRVTDFRNELNNLVRGITPERT